jgi:hypothetical protein
MTLRTGKESDMLPVPKVAEPLLSAFSVAFTRPTFQRVVVLFLGAVLAVRQRTVTNLLQTLGPLAKGHWSSFHRVLCRRVWSCQTLGRVLAAMILELLPPKQQVVCLVDDTASQHKGRRVYGKARHRDAVRSSHSHTVWLFGHRWVVLAINVRFPFASRPWALPVLCALYRSRELNRTEARRHKTPVHLARQLMAMLIHWFPERTFILVGDGEYAAHELARFCWRHRRHVTLISRFHPDARLYEAPPPRRAGERGRPRIKGPALPAPGAVVQAAKARGCTVSWYGGTQRRVELISGTGHWYRAGAGLVPVRWVFVRDLEGTHRDEYFYSTDVTIKPQRIVSLYTGRWSIEVTFQEVRAHLGFTTPRNWSPKSVLRTAPCLLGLFSLICLIYQRHARRHRPKPLCCAWYSRSECTFSDAIVTVRRLCWAEILKRPPYHRHVKKLPDRLRRVLLNQLSRAA